MRATLASWWIRQPWCVLYGLCVLAACASPDAQKLDRSPAGSGGGGAMDDGGAGMGAGGSGGSGGSMAGSGGSGGGAGAAGAAGSGGGECVPNPNLEDEVCTEVCPEICNDEDDDCDRKIDEGDADLACALPNATSACERGVCLVVTCSGDFRDCDQDASNGCEALLGSVDHCGGCDDACVFENALATCFEGVCVPGGCLDTHGDCDISLDSCETPLDTLTDCGGCGESCDGLDQATPTCETGTCAVDTCIGNYGDCNVSAADGCEQPLDSLEHCGGCGESCSFMGTTSDCSTGTCVALGCASGFADCDGNTANGCESLNTEDYCGGCGKPCNTAALANVAAATCENLTCNVSCNTGFGDCDVDASNGCETSLTSNVNCGNCGEPCEISNAVAACGSGSCEFVSCLSGWGDCNANLDDGCETNLNTTLGDCGTCGNDCTDTGKVSCSGGNCSGLSCPAPTADCDGDDVDCDGNLSLLTSCGSCTNACTFSGGLTPATAHGTLTCTNPGGTYACGVTCATGFANCDGNYRNGCETPLNTLTSCGACGQGCAIPNAVETCANRVCEVQSCDPDWGNCDSNPNTCERALNTTSDCGACNADCDFPFAVESCGGSPGSRSCAISSCADADHRNCDSQTPNGCEINVTNTVAHCGACNNNCNSLPNVNVVGCSGSACTITSCDAGFGNCTGAAGCETSTTTTANCGACGNDCTALANTAAVTCSGGTSCGITSCDPGYGNCNGTVGDGCETDLYTLANCGGCASMGQNQNCAALPHVAVASCGAGACQVGQCASGWADCNGLPADGCEHDLGGLGACDPDTNCTKSTWATNGHTYWVCNNARPWSEARARCLMLNNADLTDIGSAAENSHVASLLGGSSRWLGANDQTLEGTWRWGGTNVPFWVGAAGGSGVGTFYKNWGGGEPNDVNGEDCAEMRTDGMWNDLACSTTRGFVCEVHVDACAADASKYDPGQCGCGVADTDGDGDLIANCIDGCPSDASKRAMGVCGCGIADTDTDSDTFADCIESCDSNPAKQDPGQCGCSVADTDTDGDGTANCNDLCPNNAPKTAPGTCGCALPDVDTDGDGTLDCNDGCPTNPATTSACFPYTPTNFDPASLNFTTAPDTTLDCASTTITIDTSNTPTITGWCGTVPTPVVQGSYVIVPLKGFTLPAGKTLRTTGTRPLILAVQGNATIAGTINARGTATTPGAGGNVSCSPGTGGLGGSDNADAGGGGGGGGFGLAGAAGGRGHGGSSQAAGGTAGGTGGVVTLGPLRGGCAGGRGGVGSSDTPGGGGLGGAGGGALQLSVSGTLSVPATGVISASGGAGQRGSDEHGGGGGGSGGAVLLEGGTVSVALGAWVTANGGGGAGGNNGSHGTDGSANSTARAAGGAGAGSAGAGGLGGASAGAATVGGQGGSNDGGGGGGGGVGRIRINSPNACTLSGGFSPAQSQGC